MGRMLIRGVWRYIWVWGMQGIAALVQLVVPAYNANRPTGWPEVTFPIEWTIFLLMLGLLVALVLAYRDLHHDLTKPDPWSAYDFYRDQGNIVTTVRNTWQSDDATLAFEHGKIVGTLQTTLRAKGRHDEADDLEPLKTPRHVQAGFDHSSPGNLHRSFLIELEGRLNKFRDAHRPKRDAR